MYYTYPYANPYVVPAVSSPTPVYFILLLGLTFFLWSSSLNNMMPGADKVAAWTPLVLQAAFAILLLTYCANMLGGIRGVNPIELTWVHLTAGMLVFFIMWNYNLANQPPPPEKRSSSSSSSSSKPAEAPPSKPKEAPKEPDPWEHELAHPSAFLTTRKVEPKPWPFPMGLADGKDKLKLWWESGLPSHVGHFNRPLPPIEKKEKEVRKVEEKKEAKPVEGKPEPTPDKPEKSKALSPEQELEERRKRKEAEAKQIKEKEMAKIAAMVQAKRQYIQEEATKRLWRMRILCFIVGFSLVHKPSAFFMLLAFAMNVISGWLNPIVPPPDPPKVEKGSSESKSSELRSRSEFKDSSSSREAKEAPPKDSREAALRAEARAARPEPRETGERAAEPRERSEPRESSSAKETSRSRSEDVKPRESSREASKESSSRSSSREAVDGRSSSSSSSKPEVVTSEAIKKASGSTTVTKSNDSATQPKIGFGMHYIHSIDKDALMDPSAIPSRGTAHPLMTSFDPGLAN